MLTTFLLMTLQAAAPALAPAPAPPPPGKLVCTYSNAGVTVRKRFEQDRTVVLDKLFDARGDVAMTGMPVFAYRVGPDGAAGVMSIERADFTFAIKGVQRAPESLRFFRNDKALGPILLFSPPLYTPPGQPLVYQGTLNPKPVPGTLVQTLEGATGWFRVKVNSKGVTFTDEYLRVSTADMAAAATRALPKVKGAKDAMPRPC